MADLLTAAACDCDDVPYHLEARWGLIVDGFGDGIRLLQLDIGQAGHAGTSSGERVPRLPSEA